MFLIANNITTRDPEIEHIFGQARTATWKVDSAPAEALMSLAKQCTEAGADAIEINLQQHYDQPEAMDFAINVVQRVISKQLCLSTNNAETLAAGLSACLHSPLVNYLSVDEVRLKEMLPAIAKRGAGVVFLASDPTATAYAREMLHKTAILAGAANEAGIPNDDIFVDPGLIHVTSDAGQRHLVEVMEFLHALPDAIDPPVKSTCWLVNSSAGAPRRLRPVIETMLLSMLAGAGLSSAFLDILQPENRQAARLLRIFNNETVYAESDVEL